LVLLLLLLLNNDDDDDDDDDDDVMIIYCGSPDVMRPARSLLRYSVVVVIYGGWNEDASIYNALL